jgi:hypothetical protein
MKKPISEGPSFTIPSSSVENLRTRRKQFTPSIGSVNLDALEDEIVSSL